MKNKIKQITKEAVIKFLIIAPWVICYGLVIWLGGNYLGNKLADELIPTNNYQTINLSR